MNSHFGGNSCQKGGQDGSRLQFVSRLHSLVGLAMPPVDPNHAHLPPGAGGGGGGSREVITAGMCTLTRRPCVMASSRTQTVNTDVCAASL